MYPHPMLTTGNVIPISTNFSPYSISYSM